MLFLRQSLKQYKSTMSVSQRKANASSLLCFADRTDKCVIIAINVAATFPLGFDASGRTKYPVLLRPYGGPGSQTVQQRFRMDWTHYLATEGYIILEIDGRGTGYMGRTFRTCIRDNLGQHEAEDQIAVAEWYRDKCSYIDPKRIGIQGWSYGGCVR